MKGKERTETEAKGEKKEGGGKATDTEEQGKRTDGDTKYQDRADKKSSFVRLKKKHYFCILE